MRAIFIDGPLKGYRRNVGNETEEIKEMRYGAEPYSVNPACQNTFTRHFTYDRVCVMNLGQPIAYFKLRTNPVGGVAQHQASKEGIMRLAMDEMNRAQNLQGESMGWLGGLGGFRI